MKKERVNSSFSHLSGAVNFDVMYEVENPPGRWWQFCHRAIVRVKIYLARQFPR